MYKIPVASCVVFDQLENKVLLQHRIQPGTPDDDKWSFCGGKVHENETIFDACGRELREESGLISLHSKSNPEQLIGITHTREYLILFLLVTRFEGVACNNEPHKTKELRWVKTWQIHGMDLTQGMKTFCVSELYGKFLELAQQK